MPFGKVTREDNDVVVRQYGLREPTDLDDDIIDEFRRSNRLWNALVEFEQSNREEYRVLMAQDPEVGKIETEIEAERMRLQQASDARKSARKKTRSRVNTEIKDDVIRDARAKIHEISARLKEARKSAREQMRPKLEVLDTERKAQVKNARQQSGLYWGNYNAVVASYETARQRAMKDGAELRFHSFDGSGRLTCQIQGGMSVEDLFSGTSSQVGVDPVAPAAWSSTHRGERRRLARTELRFLAFTYRDENDTAQKRYLHFPMVMHRAIPGEVRIKQVVVTRKRTGSYFRWQVVFTCTQTKVNRHVKHAGPRAAINFGWRKTPRGLRVAMLVDEDGRRQEILLPDVMLQRLKWCESLQAKRKQATNELWAELAPLLRELPAERMSELLAEQMAELFKAPEIGPRTLVRLMSVWQREDGDLRPDLLALLSEWRKRDKRWWDHGSSLREKISKRRRDIFRNVALDMVRKYSEIAVGNTNFRLLARRKDVGEDLPQATRHQRVLAAPGELRSWLKLQATKTGTSITVVVEKNLALRCNACGCDHVFNTRRNRREDLMWTCGHCRVLFDQDENYALNLLDQCIRTPAERPLPVNFERSGGE